MPYFHGNLTIKTQLKWKRAVFFKDFLAQAHPQEHILFRGTEQQYFYMKLKMRRGGGEIYEKFTTSN